MLSGAELGASLIRWSCMEKAKRRLVMKNAIRNGALVFSLLAGAALISAPATTATAKSIQQDGYFGGTWSPIGPKDNRHVRRYDRRHGYYGPRRGYYYGPRRGYAYYGPRRDYYYGSPYGYDYGPGFGFSIRVR
jgi:hypothetical protein